MNNYKHLKVYLNDRMVGTLALADRYLVAFEYTAEWLENGYSISPRSLPLEKKVFIPKIQPFDGLYGVFQDSLPDGWGRQEYDYSLCAKKCGIEMTETRLLPSKNCEGYFGTKRFDRNGDKRIHMISVSALLETSHRYPNLDYNILMRLVLWLTGDYEEVEKMFRLMCFNVFAHNRDDHSKNFSFLYNEEEKRYKLSPAYDLTYSNSLGGEHATCVNGNGSNPTKKDLLAVADNINLDHKKALKIADSIEEIVKNDLDRYLTVR